MTVQEALAAPHLAKLRVEDFLLLADAGAFADYAKAELVEGVIVAVNAQYSRHARFQRLLFRRLADACDALSADIEAWFEVSIALAAQSMPQPDLLVARGAPENGPMPLVSVILVVEVSDSTLDFDLGTKATLYATAGVPEYWVADVNARVIHQLWAPAGEGYAERREAAFGEWIAAATVAGLAVETGEISG